MKQRHRLIAPMPPGPLDVVGDVHGELGLLERLLERLGRDPVTLGPTGRRAAGRSLVFVGDLVDRGPDSVGVLRRVMPAVRERRAFCVMGNHELNALRVPDAVDHSHWFHGGGVGPPTMPQAVLPPEQRADVLGFFRSLPLALEREDVVAVHACWDAASADRLRGADDPVDAWRRAHDLTPPGGWEAAVDPADPAAADARLVRRNANPVRRLTAGPEHRAPHPFRIHDRVFRDARTPWWDAYAGPPYVIFGHYWRRPGETPAVGDPALPFGGHGPTDELGLPGSDGRRSAMCIDHCAGASWQRRPPAVAAGVAPIATGLSAFRWPERELVFVPGA
ncbi:metallophosphoesterase [Phycisphaera mikurensis]|uniref:Putative hydrolase n=1 Tax=Phycisphaera mikurensis (strain NBRC 102666 / KCTC 22515 / FYK2301M01) TaxID=1142394 RepID=I0IFE7_PHYMF|nr:metallophosphoesterase [Phycisphaera mikurensis]MBB6440622.1 hypothetical protein [Phycisphaera mikurensis]BAM03985.1 putative hydrolase [Phycisphaera mikurensis NBRC 102666]